MKMKKFWVGFLCVFSSIVIIAVFVYTGFYIGKETTELVSTTAETGATAPVEAEEETKRAIDEMAVFQKFTADYWEQGLSFTQIESILSELAVVIAYHLGLESIPKIEVIYEKTNTYLGVYKQNSHLIQMNYYKIFQSSTPSLQSVETLAHELRHDFQRERYDAGYETPLEKSYANYLSFEEYGYNLYYNQLCEVDSRAYASFYRKYFEAQINDYEKGE